MCNWKLKQSQELNNLEFFYFTGVLAKQVAREGFRQNCPIIKYLMKSTHALNYYNLVILIDLEIE